MKKLLLPLLTAFVLWACDSQPTASETTLLTLLNSTEGKTGNPDYLKSPFVTAGDRVYLVGHQDGSFPDLGWHVRGEMGGLWNHPIKLLDGFTLGVSNGQNFWCLTEADRFINYPVANQHDFSLGEGLTATRIQFVPDGLEGIVVEYTLTNTGTDPSNLQLEFTGMSDLSPVWLAERLNVTDGNDVAEFDQKINAWVASDSLNSWFVMVGTDQPVKGWKSPYADCSFERKGLGTDLTLVSDLTLEPGASQSVRYFVAGSYKSKAMAAETFNRIKDDPARLLQQKIARYDQLRSTADLTLPDGDIQELYNWTKYTTDWLIREVPELGRGVSAGLPDYPWWFGTDNTYTLQGMLATGQHREVKATLDLLLKLSDSANGNGRIVHEVSTNGVVFNLGNLNTTPYFIHLLWKYFLWTGDRHFLAQTFPTVRNGLEWLASQDKDGNGYPDGAGMMEIHGLHSEMIDVVVYTQAAYQASANMAEVLGNAEMQRSYQQKADELKAKINSDWWVDRAGSFADFKATKEETLELIDAAILRADTLEKPWAVEELSAVRKEVTRLPNNQQQGHVVHHNWVVNTPLELGIADPEKAERALETARRYTSRFGMYVTGIDRKEGQEQAEKWQSFSYVGAVMTLPTGVQAISEARYGHPDRTLAYLKNLHNSFGYALPGSMYEVSPDYGMVAQAWNSYAVAVPIIEYFFGVKPEAHKQVVRLQPDMPSGWETATLSDLVVGSNTLTIDRNKDGYTIEQSQSDWEVELILPSNGISSLMVNGTSTPFDPTEGQIRLSLTGTTNEILIK